MTDNNQRPKWWVCDRCGAKYSMSITKCLFNACPTNLPNKINKPLHRMKVLELIDSYGYGGQSRELLEIREVILSGNLDMEEE